MSEKQLSVSKTFLIVSYVSKQCIFSLKHENLVIKGGGKKTREGNIKDKKWNILSLNTQKEI